jgi:hypothetical protein
MFPFATLADADVADMTRLAMTVPVADDAVADEPLIPPAVLRVPDAEDGVTDVADTVSMATTVP